jgi:phosphoribosyl-ATP pyrophosphohydrolase/phosphoribosyl-AMP cyclohydrolase
MIKSNDLFNRIDWEKGNGIVPIVVQNEEKDVLTLGYMNKEALERTLKSRNVFYYSRTKNRIRMKGEISGNFQFLKDIRLDCDNDALILTVEQIGPACHFGTKSCFTEKVELPKEEGKIDYSYSILQELENVIKTRKDNPDEKSNTSFLFKESKEKIFKKFGEEAVEVLVAENRERRIYETADMLYQLLVVLSYEGIDFSEILKELKGRRK